MADVVFYGDDGDGVCDGDDWVWREGVVVGESVWVCGVFGAD